jgi:dCTP deaminase
LRVALRASGRSSLARTGLQVHFTAPTIHPGFTGTIALEMINLGKIPLTLRPGSRVCQLIVETVEGEPVRADSRFQGQAQATG